LGVSGCRGRGSGRHGDGVVLIFLCRIAASLKLQFTFLVASSCVSFFFCDDMVTTTTINVTKCDDQCDNQVTTCDNRRHLEWLHVTTWWRLMWLHVTTVVTWSDYMWLHGDD
jgi:hypothetical protein